MCNVNPYPNYQERTYIIPEFAPMPGTITTYYPKFVIWNNIQKPKYKYKYKVNNRPKRKLA